MVRPTQKPIIVWFRDDLRLADQPALAAAKAHGGPVLCVYVLDEVSAGLRPLGGASRWWLHHSLEQLAASLSKIGARLDLLKGASDQIIPKLAQAVGADHVVWTRRYGAAEIALDSKIKTLLKQQGVTAESFKGQLLFEPWELQTKAGGPFKVFTPFWRAALALGDGEAPLKAPTKLNGLDWDAASGKTQSLASLKLLPTKPDWAGGLRKSWQVGEAGARARLSDFLEVGLAHYAEERDRADRDSTSRLSPHLRFGEISPKQILWAARHAGMAGSIGPRNVDKFVAEIGWREFSYHLLYHFPKLREDNFQPRFDDFPWGKANKKTLSLWHKGQTGYPIVDAGMRELWQTGTMHNRVRMIVASFLIKHLMIDWREGEDWFWDTLCDADPASNPASWQWVAGSGADAAPYFRIFNPIIQGEKFDPDGLYVRRYVPELGSLASKWIHHPWDAPEDVLKTAGIKLGKSYPAPIIDHGQARDRALAAFASLKQ
jgi:deoxyribodipyrimidine photo-lyase